MKNIALLIALIGIFIATSPDKKVQKKKISFDVTDLIGKCFKADKSFLNHDSSFMPFVKIKKGNSDYLLAEYYYRQIDAIKISEKKINTKKILKRKRIKCPF